MKALYVLCVALIVMAAGLLVSCSKSTSTQPNAGVSAPELTAPANGAQNQPAQLTLSWGSVSSASKYNVQVSMNNGFNSTVLAQELTSTSTSVSSLASGVTYYWRVNAANADSTSPWSGTWSFSVAGTAVLALFMPANGATNQPISPVLTWFPATGASAYNVQVSSASDFSTIVSSLTGLTDASGAPTGLAAGTVYFWRVNSLQGGVTSPWTSAWSFTTVTAPAAPVQSAPANGATDQPLTTVIGWSPSAQATSYNVQVATTSDFASTISAMSGVSGTFAALPGLAAGTTYYWQVNAQNAAGAGAWSAAWSFTTATTAVTVPASPALTSPQNGATGLPNSVTISWNPSTSASSYSIQVSTSSTFNSIVANQTAIAATSTTINGLTNHTTYYWQVNASNSTGTSSWSGVWSFSTIITPAAPVLVSPANAAGAQSATLTLSWSASTQASSYALMVSTSPTFATTVQSASGLETTSQPLSGLAYGRTFYWKVNATNAAGTSEWSSTWSFFTISTPTSPALLAPANAVTGQPIIMAVNWNPSPNAASYTLQVSTSANFTTLFSEQPGIPGISTSLPQLAYGTRYYWRVNATNEAGTSLWSNAWNFMTLTVPTVPTLSAPANGTTGLPTSNFLSWNSVAGAQSYNLQVSTSTTFTPLVSDQSQLQATSSTVTGLDRNATYYWHVNSANEAGSSAWSAAWSFKTAQ